MGPAFARLMLGLVLVAGCDNSGTAPGLDGGGDAGGGGDLAGGGGDGGTLCGNRVVDYAAGEECDDGNAAAGDGCTPTCVREKPATCGDGNLDLARGEQCDDMNTAAGDGCSPTCQFEKVGASCGNMMMENREVCDDGNVANGDACNPTCNLANTTSLFAGGRGMPGSMDGVGPAARFGGTAAMAVDKSYLWVGDDASFRVRRVEVATADVRSIAGTGAMGYRDDPVGAMAQFGAMSSIATDGITLWIGDARRIRAVTVAPPHAVTTVAGSGMQGVADGVGNAATFDDLRGLTYYAGMVYSLDANGAVLRRFDPATNTVTTIAGTAYMTGRVDGVGAAARFTSPRYLASDNSGMLYISDTNGNQIRAYNTVTGAVTTFVGSGQVGYVDAVGTQAAVHRPRGMTSDGTSIYWAEFNQHTIRQAVLASASVTTLVGMHCGGAAMCNGGYMEGVGTQARFNGPWNIVFHYPTNSLFVFDGGNNVIRRIR